MKDHFVLRHMLGRMLGFFHWIDIQGLERIPQSGRLILAVNHCGVRGGLVLEACLHRDVIYIASARFLHFPIIRQLARRIGAIFVSPMDMFTTRILDEATNVLDTGRMLGVMVEGRQMDLHQGELKRGAAYLAHRLSADILPVSVDMHGLQLKIRIGDVLPKPVSVHASSLEQTMAEIALQLGIGKQVLS